MKAGGTNAVLCAQAGNSGRAGRLADGLGAFGWCGTAGGGVPAVSRAGERRVSCRAAA